MIILRKGGTIKRVVGGGGGGGRRKNYAKVDDWKEKECSKDEVKKTNPAEWITLPGLQTVLAWIALWQPLQYCSFNFLVPVESPLT